MDTAKKNRLLECLRPYKRLIDATNNQSYLLQFHQISELNTLNQIAGNPFIDRYSSIPKDDNGKDMLLLAQIDFNEIPLQHPFPSNGIIQFFVNKEFGKPHFPKKHEQFYVRYLEQSLITNKKLSSFTYKDCIESVPIPYKFTGILKEEPVSCFDYRYKIYFNEPDHIISVDERTFHEVYTMSFLGAEHKIGGYPYFIYEDFRSKNTHLQKYDTLLLQLITDDEYGIGYRDSGIISFFIEEEKLINKDFTNVYMHTEHY